LPADREPGLPTPAEPERVAPASRQSKWAGSTRRCTRTALVTAPSSVWHHPGLGAPNCGGLPIVGAQRFPPCKLWSIWRKSAQLAIVPDHNPPLTRDCLRDLRLWPGCETVERVAVLGDGRANLRFTSSSTPSQEESYSAWATFYFKGCPNRYQQITDSGRILNLRRSLDLQSRSRRKLAHHSVHGLRAACRGSRSVNRQTAKRARSTARHARSHQSGGDCQPTLSVLEATFC
jgi:hypothetical protein